MEMAHLRRAGRTGMAADSLETRGQPGRDLSEFHRRHHLPRHRRRFPGGGNFAYSADHCAPELFWRGAFIDAGRHWTGRGQGAQPPASEEKLKLTDAPVIAVLNSAATTWPDQPGLTPHFKGYELDPHGNPTFTVNAPSGRSRTTSPPRARPFCASSSSAGKPLPGTALLLARQLPVKPIGSDAFEIDGKLVLTVKSAKPARLLDETTLVLPLDGISDAEIHYTWK